MRKSLSLIGLLTACNSENGTKVVNSNPEATITYPSEGSILLEGETLFLRGVVSDNNHSADQLTVSWNSGALPLCEATTPESDGAVQCEIVVTEEISEISLQVQDPNNAAGLATVTVSVTPTEAPSIIVNSPNVTDAYYSDQLILFSAVVSDGEDPPEDLSVLWSSSLDGELPITALPDSSGTLEQYLSLTEGQHSISATVEDTSGKTATETIAITVGGPNAEPSCSITEPLDDAVFIVGQSIDFDGLATDEDINNALLSVEWSSDIDGSFNFNAPNSSGELSFNHDGLSAANHTITLRVEDEVGGLCIDTVQIAIGNPPILSLTEPLDGSVYSEGDVVNFAASVSDTEDIASDITLSWESSINGEFSTQGADSNGNISFSSSSLSVGTHSMTVTATDSTGLTDSASFSLRINSEPVIDAAASISPNTGVVTGTTLTCSATIADAEDGALTPSYDWSIGGISVATGDTFSLDSSNSNVGDSVFCTATASDSDGQSVSSIASVVVENTPPTAPSVTIGPSNPVTVDSLIASASGSTDLDGDPVVYSYAWYQNGNSTSYLSDTVPSSATSVGEQWTVRVTPNDGNADGAYTEVSTIIANSSPVLSGVTLSPSSIFNDTVVSCSGSVIDDDETPTLTVEWFVAGQSVGAGSSLDLAAVSANVGESVDCVMSVSDSHGGSDSVTVNAVIQNRVPVVSSVSISPSNPFEGVDDVVCLAQASDPDGEALSLSYSWDEVNGGMMAGDTLNASMTAMGEVWTCTVTADDGTATATGSATVTIGSLDCFYGDCDEFLDLGNGRVMDFNLIPAGTDPLGRYILTRDFYMMTTEVTQGMFLQVMGYDSRTGESTAWGDGADFPAYYASWHMAAAFANAVTQQHNSVYGTSLQECFSCTGSGTSVNCVEVGDPYQCTGYVLPTEAEWEYAARSGTTSDFWTGDGLELGGEYSDSSCNGSYVNNTSITIQDGVSNPALVDYAWFCGNRWDSSYYETSKPVALLIPNGFGLYDMHGNVVEWTMDWYDNYYPASSIDPWQETGVLRSLPNGGWSSSPYSVRVSHRSYGIPSGRSEGVGIRLIRHAENTAPPPPDISLSPASPAEGIDDLHCVIDTPSSDPDGDSVSYSFDWTVDGQAYTGSTLDTDYTGDTIPASETVEGEVWECTVTPSDGTVDGSSISVDVTVVGPVDCNAILGSMSLDLGGGKVMDLNLIPGCEEPLGRYTLTRDFYLMTTEVTQGMFQQVMGYDSRTGESTAYGDGADFPAYYANWHMAAAFANAVTQRHNTVNGTSLQNCYSCSGSGASVSCSEVGDPYQCTGYVLPTEAEWEYAARSGTTSEFWTGDGPSLGGTYSVDTCDSSVSIQDGVSNPILSDYAWFCGNSGSASHEVGLKLPNSFGLYDMHGNMREWTGDWYGCSYPQSTTDPLCLAGTNRVVRGGNWGYGPSYGGASYRFNDSPTFRGNGGIGFRLGLHP